MLIQRCGEWVQSFYRQSSTLSHKTYRTLQAMLKELNYVQRTILSVSTDYLQDLVV